MNGWFITSLIGVYFAILVGISLWTSRKADNATWFSANRSAPWPIVAYGMIGASLSGVTFLSIPGWVGTTQFTYMPVVFGYLIGYAIIALVLLPIYYNQNVTSIYEYLGSRFGPVTHKCGALFFLLSRTIGAAFRLYLVALVFQILLKRMGFGEIPFFIPVFVTIALIFIYTFKGGIKTVVWTDLLQTTFMLGAALLAILGIAKALDLSLWDLIHQVQTGPHSQMLVFDWTKDNHFLKQLVSGAFIALAMTGLDQDMMQKNLTCPTRQSAQKNMALFCVILVIVNFGFLYLGGALYAFGARTGFVSLTGDPSFPISMLDPINNTMVPRLTDELFAYMALDYMSVPIATAFILGLIAAAYSSADSALTGLTTSFCVDVLGFSRKPSSPGNQRTRMLVQTGFALLLFLVILIFKGISSPAVISSIFKAAGFTYGPLLGFFAFGLLLPRCRIPDRASPVAAIISVTATWFINREFSQSIGFLILPINGMITFMLLFLLHVMSRFRPQAHA